MFALLCFWLASSQNLYRCGCCHSRYIHTEQQLLDFYVRGQCSRFLEGHVIHTVCDSLHSPPLSAGPAAAPRTHKNDFDFEEGLILEEWMKIACTWLWYFPELSWNLNFLTACFQIIFQISGCIAMPPYSTHLKVSIVLHCWKRYSKIDILTYRLSCKLCLKSSKAIYNKLSKLSHAVASTLTSTKYEINEFMTNKQTNNK